MAIESESKEGERLFIDLWGTQCVCVMRAVSSQQVDLRNATCRHKMLFVVCSLSLSSSLSFCLFQVQVEVHRVRESKML